jgi:hypothetical protein
LILTVHEHFDFALFRPDHNRLIAHAAHHVKGIHRPASKGQFKGVFLNAFLQCAF